MQDRREVGKVGEGIIYKTAVKFEILVIMV